MLETKKKRIDNIDILRGLVIILMCFDHARDYTGIMPSDPMDLNSTPSFVFFLRNAAHFCAPIFIFLTGLSSYIGNLSSSYLLKRGLILLLLEVTLVNWGWSFNPLFSVTYLQVIWAIGVAMILLAAAKHLNRYFLLAIAVGIIGFHNLFSDVSFAEGSGMHYIWSFVLQKNLLPTLGDHMVRTTYPVLPVFAIMAFGYFMGYFYKQKESNSRKKILFSTSAVMLGLFVVLRIIFKYGDASVVNEENFWFSLFNMTKYPMSFNFILFYLSLGILALALTDEKTYGEKNLLRVFGQVPMFFYISHLYILHIIILVYAIIHRQELDFTKYLGGVPYSFGYPLWALFVVVPLTLAILYYPCVYYNKIKRKKHPITKYI